MLEQQLQKNNEFIWWLLTTKVWAFHITIMFFSSKRFKRVHYALSSNIFSKRLIPQKPTLQHDKTRFSKNAIVLLGGAEKSQIKEETQMEVSYSSRAVPDSGCLSFTLWKEWIKWTNNKESNLTSSSVTIDWHYRKFQLLARKGGTALEILVKKKLTNKISLFNLQFVCFLKEM